MARRRRARSGPVDGLLWMAGAAAFMGGLYLVATVWYALVTGTIEGEWATTGAVLVAVAVVGLAVGRPRFAWAVVRWASAKWRRHRMPARPAGPVATSRTPIPAGLRFAVLHRDGFRCAYCGRGQGEGARLHLDHLVPVARGGRNELDNLVTACQDCNLGKSAADLVGAD